MSTLNTSFALATLMWFGMMAAMMLPVSVPWVRVLISLSEGGGRGSAAHGARPARRGQADAPGPALFWNRIRSGALFLAGYLGVWMLFSMAAAAVQYWLGVRIALAGGSPLAGAVLVGAGLYQLSPVKAACLRHCRNPLTYFLTRWRDGPRGALGMGWGHGLYCLGCCWALMALALVLGVMNLVWMAVLAAVVFTENVAPGGTVIGRVAGVGLVVWGVVAWVGG